MEHLNCKFCGKPFEIQADQIRHETECKKTAKFVTVEIAKFVTKCKMCGTVIETPKMKPGDFTKFHFDGVDNHLGRDTIRVLKHQICEDCDND